MFSFKFGFIILCLSVVVYPNISFSELRKAQYAQLDYDVVYVRCPRARGPVNLGGKPLLNWNGVNDIWLSASNNIYHQPGCDLVLHKKGFAGGDAAAEEVLVDCDESATEAAICTVVDPNVSFDGRYIAYTKFEDTRTTIGFEGMLQATAGGASHYQRLLEIFPNGEGPNGGSWSYASGLGVEFRAFSAPAHIYVYDLLEKREIKVSPSDSFFSGRAYPGKPEDWVSKVPIMDTGPFFMSNGKIGFTSNRDSGFYKFQLFSVGMDGSNLELLGHRAMSQQLHPAVLKDGRIMYTSADKMLYKTANNNYSLFVVDPDGGNPFILVGKQDPTFFSYHYATQLSGGDIVSAIYYNRNNVGLGSLLRFPVDPEGADFVHLTDKMQPYVEDGNWVAGVNLRPFSRVGEYRLTTQADSSDYQARPYRDAYGYTAQDEWIHPNGYKVTMMGKFSHPSGVPDNDLLVTYAIGGTSQTDSDFSTIEKTQETIGKDAGVWLLPLSLEGSQTVDHIADDGLLVVDFPEYHEIMPRAVVTYEQTYGIKKPDVDNVKTSRKNNGLIDPRLKAGEPFGLSGAATLFDRETLSLNGTPWNAVASANRGGRNYSNLETNGADLAIYTNDEIAGIRVLIPLANYPKDLPSGLEKKAGTANYLRILGEFPVLKFNQGQPVLDQDGNPDTSFVIKLPANTPFLFQSIDKRGMALDIETTSRTVARGEQQFCGGCHVHTRESLDPFSSYAKLDVNWLADFSGEDAPLLNSYTDAGEVTVLPAKQVYSSDLVPGLNLRRSFAIDWVNGMGQLIEKRCASCHAEGAPAQQLTGLRLDGDVRTYDLITSNSYVREDGERISSSTKPGDGLSDVLNNIQGTDRITPRFGCCTASRWLSYTSARSSMLAWALWGERFDGRDNVTGLPSVESGVPVDPYGKERPEIWPKVGEHASYLSDMPEAEKRLIARWIDIGAPKSNVHEDKVRPVLTITPILEAGSVSEVMIGVWDDSPVDYSRFEVKYNGSVIMAGSDVVGEPSVINVTLPVAISGENADSQEYSFEIWDKPDRSLSLIKPGVFAANRERRVVSGRELLRLADAALNASPSFTSAQINVESGVESSFFPVVVDSDVGDSHYYEIISSPGNGTALVKNNRLVYQSNAGFVGQDSFQFRATDLGGLSVQGSAVINVAAKINKAPSIQVFFLNGYQNQLLSGTPIILDSDVGDTYTLAVVNQPSNGAASISGNNVEYLPRGDFSGSDVFTLQVTDMAGLSGTAVVSVMVELRPEIGGENVAPTDVMAQLEGDSGQVITALPSYLDANVDDIHTLAIVNQPANGVAGVVNDQLTYVANMGFSGQDDFLFRVTDSGGLWAEGIAVVMVNAVVPSPDPQQTEPEPEPEPQPQVTDPDPLVTDPDPLQVDSQQSEPNTQDSELDLNTNQSDLTDFAKGDESAATIGLQVDNELGSKKLFLSSFSYQEALLIMSFLLLVRCYSGRRKFV